MPVRADEAAEREVIEGSRPDSGGLPRSSGDVTRATPEPTVERFPESLPGHVS